jgi:hypothetical protein
MDMNGTKTNRKNTATVPPPPSSREQAEIDMKGAVRIALAFAKDMLPVAKDIRLEEVEPVSVGWSVVISYATNQSPSFAILRGEEESRSYKKIAINAETGTAQSLKVWK